MFFKRETLGMSPHQCTSYISSTQDKASWTSLGPYIRTYGLRIRKAPKIFSTTIYHRVSASSNGNYYRNNDLLPVIVGI